MQKVIAIGMGVGDPEQLTLQAIAALNQVDVFFAIDKGEATADMRELRKRICERHIRDRSYRFVEIPELPRDASIASYDERVRVWHAQRAERYRALFARELGESGCGGILVWGDPSLYDSTLRILADLAAMSGSELAYEVVPGISSVQALAAAHRIPLHRIGGALHITTGRRLPADAAHSDDILVMLDGECAFRALDPDAFEIYWGAYLGSPHRLLERGLLREAGLRIERLRAEARAARGWIMDTYLLKRVAPRP